MSILTFGMTLKGCVRFCAIAGIFTSSFYVTAGVTMISRSIQEQHNGPYAKPLYLFLTYEERESARLEKMKFAVCVSLGTALIVINVIQMICDTLLFQLSLKTCYGRSIWILFVLDIILWITTLICFISVFPAGGILLMVIVLIGTSIRCYILYIIHSYFSQLRKLSDSNLNLQCGENGMESFKTKEDPFIAT